MKAGWKTRIEERRYFEEKRREWRKRVIDEQFMQARLKFDEEQTDAFLALLARPVKSTFPKI